MEKCFLQVFFKRLTEEVIKVSVSGVCFSRLFQVSAQPLYLDQHLS